jgi:hypothetical protein
MAASVAVFRDVWQYYRHGNILEPSKWLANGHYAAGLRGAGVKMTAAAKIGTRLVAIESPGPSDPIEAVAIRPP